MLLANGVLSMITSGNQGGNPVISRAGAETNSNFMCYQTIGEARPHPATHDFGNINIDRVPMDLIKKKISLELQGIDEDVIMMHVDKERQEFQRKLKEEASAQRKAVAQKDQSAVFKVERREARVQRDIPKHLNERFYKT